MRRLLSRPSGPLVVLFLVACGQPLFHAPPRPEPAHTPMVPPPSGADAIARVSMHTTTCFGTCPDYALTFLISGLVIRNGGQYSKLPPCSSGRVTDSTFHALAGTLLTEGFFQRDVFVGRPMFDVPYLTISATLTDGRTHAVTGAAEPPELRPIRSAMDSLAGTIAWQTPKGDLLVQGCPPGPR